MGTGLASTGGFKEKPAHHPPQVSQRKPYLCQWTVFMQTFIEQLLLNSSVHIEKLRHKYLPPGKHRLAPECQGQWVWFDLVLGVRVVSCACQSLYLTHAWCLRRSEKEDGFPIEPELQTVGSGLWVLEIKPKSSKVRALKRAAIAPAWCMVFKELYHQTLPTLPLLSGTQKPRSGPVFAEGVSLSYCTNTSSWQVVTFALVRQKNDIYFSLHNRPIYIYFLDESRVWPPEQLQLARAPNHPSSSLHSISMWQRSCKATWGAERNVFAMT